MAEFKVTNTDGKIEILKHLRGVDIYRVQKILNDGEWIDSFDHPKNENQRIYVIIMDDYCYVVPVVKTDLLIKTVYASSRCTKIYLKNAKE